MFPTISQHCGQFSSKLALRVNPSQFSRSFSKVITYHPLGSLQVSNPLRSKVNEVLFAGTGLTAVWGAYRLCRDLERAEQGRHFKIIMVGKEDWQKAVKKASVRSLTEFTHETSSIGPIALQFQQGSIPWNVDDEAIELVQKGIGKPGAAFYTSPDLDREGKQFLELYTGWPGRHPDQENDRASSFGRYSSLVAINRLAWQEWTRFQKEHEFTSEYNIINLSLKGAYRLYNEPMHFANALSSQNVLSKFSFGGKVFTETEELARQIPFFWKIIVHERMKALFFDKEGLVNSNKLRHYLWRYLGEPRPGKPEVEFHLDSEVSRLNVNSWNDCEGVVLTNGKVIKANTVVLAMGLANKTVLRQHSFHLPLYGIWGAAIKGKLTDSIPPHPGGVSFHSQRCVAGSPDGKRMVVAGTNMVVPENTVPSPRVYLSKMHNNFEEIIGKDRVDQSSIVVQVAARTGTPDDLPVIGLHGRLVVLNPTYHLGNTQGPALAKIASGYIQRTYDITPEDRLPDEVVLSSFGVNRFVRDISMVTGKTPLLNFDVKN